MVKLRGVALTLVFLACFPLRSAAQSAIAEPVQTLEPLPVVQQIVDVSPLQAENRIIRATEADELAARTAASCQNVVYRNDGASAYYPFGGDTTVRYVADDCTLAAGTPNRFLCAALVKTFGINLGGASTYDLRIGIWTDCPESQDAVLVATGSYLGIP